MAQASSLARTLMNLRPGDHLCSIYSDEDARRLVLTEFLRQGLEQNEKVLYLFDADAVEAASAELLDAGIDVPYHVARGHLTLVHACDAYLAEGRFDARRMIAWLREETERAVAQGYDALRVAGEMAWVLGGHCDPGCVVEYEARLNDFFPQRRCVALCQYDRRRFAPEVLLNVLRAHPKAVIDAELYDNFYYIPPAELLSSDLSAVVLRHWISHIENHKQTLESLRQERDFIDVVLDTAGALIVVLDPEGRVVRCNRAFVHMTGRAMDDVRGEYYWDVFLPSDEVADVKRVFENLLAQNLPSTYENHVLSQDGDPRLIAWSNTVLTDAQGNVEHVVGIGIDITERQRSEDALRRERDLLGRIMETSPMCITVADRRGRIVFANTRAEEVLGLERDQITDRTYNSPAWRITDYDGQPVPDEALPFQRVMHAKAPVFDVRHAIEWPDGRRVMLSVSGAPMVDAEGRVDRIIFMIEDVTQQVEYERALSWAVDVNAALAELARTLLASSSLEDISALVLEQAKRLTNSRWGYVGYVDLQTGHLICPTMTTDVWEVCQVPDKDIVFETFTGLWGWVLRNKESLLTNAPAEDSRSTGTPPGHVPIERFLSAPALIGEELVGQVALANADRDYGERELELVERLAALYALAIQRRRTESALRRSERKYRNLFEHANDSIFIVDPETLRFLEVNEKAAQRLGYRREELLAMTVDAISAPGRETSIDGLVDALKEQGSIVFEHVHRRKDGSEMPVEISSRLVDYENRTVIQSLVRDITERKQAEKAREREIEALQLLTGAPRAGVTAEMFGLLPLNKGLPDVFSELVARYGELLDLALEERVYKVSHDVSEQLRPLAERLGFLRAGPRDVVEIHLTALRKKSQDVPAQKAQAYAEEGRMMVLELMGHLTAYYRNSGGVLTEVAASHSQEGGRDGE